MRSIIALIMRKPKPTIVVDEVKIDLLVDMRIAMHEFKKAWQKYEHNTVSGVAYSQMLFAEMEVYRARYYIARQRYESLYGNLEDYQERLNAFYNWMKERNEVCMFRQQTELSILEERIS